LVVEQTLNASDSANSNILIPQLLVGKLHNVLLSNTVDGALDLAGVHATTSGDDLSADVLSNGGGAVKGEKYRRLELSLGTLYLGLRDTLRKAGPLPEGEVDEIVEACCLIGDEVDAP
jgi:hypothetical protein